MGRGLWDRYDIMDVKRVFVASFEEVFIDFFAGGSLHTPIKEGVYLESGEGVSMVSRESFYIAIKECLQTSSKYTL